VTDHLKLLADAALDVAAAEEALDGGDPGPARDPLGRVHDALGELRARWPAMSAAERHVVGPAALELRGRLERAQARLPRHTALAVAPAEPDADEDADPAAA
jgi:hypothetical protein